MAFSNNDLIEFQSVTLEHVTHCNWIMLPKQILLQIKNKYYGWIMNKMDSTFDYAIVVFAGDTRCNM